MSATKSGNGLQKTCKTPYLALYTILYFFLIFSVAFVAGEKKSPASKGLFGVLPGNGVGNGIATSPATGSATGLQLARQHGQFFRMEVPSVGILPRSAHENRPADLSLLPIARCRKVGCVPILAVCRTWQRYEDWKTMSIPQCCCSLSR